MMSSTNSCSVSGWQMSCAHIDGGLLQLESRLSHFITSISLNYYKGVILGMSAWCFLNSTRRLSPTNPVASYGHSLGSFQDCVASTIAWRAQRTSGWEDTANLPQLNFFSENQNLLFLFNLIASSNRYFTASYYNTTLKTFIGYLQVFCLLSLRS